jgi:MerR family transcriptional regulator, redox-sensitive transcriptional activator SoxR
MDGELSIGQVAQRSGASVPTLRFYEERGLITAERTAGGQRRFRRDVLRRLAFIQAAQRVGLTLEAIGQALATLPKDVAPTKADWTRISQAWRPMLDQRIHELQVLRGQLDSCIGCGCLSLQRCKMVNANDTLAERGAGAHFLLEKFESPQ